MDFQVPRMTRRAFFKGLISGMQLTWPVLSGVSLAMIAMGTITGLFEGWSLTESICFAWVSAMPIGYGDLASESPAGRILAVCIGACGILLTALLATLAVKAMQTVQTLADGK